MLSKLAFIREALAGKKTYLVGIAGIIGASAAWGSGSMSTVDYGKYLLDSVTAMTIRAGIAKGASA